MFLKIVRLCLSAQIVCLFTLALGDTTTVNGSSGSTTVTETIGSSQWWVANSSAETATISYNGTISVNSGSRNPQKTEFKAITNGIFGPRILDGLSDQITDNFGGASVSTSGETRFSSQTPGIPQYYVTSWVTTATISGIGSYASSGTYDPWPYTVGALQGLGMQPGSLIDFYFQVRLGAGTSVVTGPNSQGIFSFNAYAHRWDSSTMPFLTATLTRGPGGVAFNATQSGDPNVFVYQLPASVALNDGISPGAKAGLGTLLGPNGVLNAFGSNLTGIGAMIDDLHFGVIVRNFQIPVGLGTNDVVFATHFDTYAQIGPVPEPATFVVLGSAMLLAFRRRYRKPTV